VLRLHVTDHSAEERSFTTTPQNTPPTLPAGASGPQLGGNAASCVALRLSHASIMATLTPHQCNDPCDAIDVSMTDESSCRNMFEFVSGCANAHHPAALSPPARTDGPLGNWGSWSLPIHRCDPGKIMCGASFSYVPRPCVQSLPALVN